MKRTGGTRGSARDRILLRARRAKLARMFVPLAVRRAPGADAMVWLVKRLKI